MQGRDAGEQGVMQFLLAEQEHVRADLQAAAGLQRQVAEKIVGKHQVELPVLAKAHVAVRQLEFPPELEGSVPR